MPSELIDAKEQTQEEVNHEFDDKIEVFQSEDEMKRSLKRLCYGDLYIIGRLWIEALKAGLVGSQMALIPVVSAAKPTDVPQKPPPMKYTELPIYQCPHYEYKDYLERKQKCPKANVKILHQYLLPKVRAYRKDLEQSACETKCGVINAYQQLKTELSDAKRDFKIKMRDPENLPIRQAVVLAGGLTGFLLGSGKGIPRRLFYTGLGVLATGALCFPKETDAGFRDFAYYSSKAVLAFYNGMCGKQISLREKIPCKEDLPPPIEPRKSSCVKK